MIFGRWQSQMVFDNGYVEVLQSADHAIILGMFRYLLICLMVFTGSAHTADDDFDAVKKAAEQGHADAQYNLGLMYDYGGGVPEDDAEAVRWYRKAAEQGD